MLDSLKDKLDSVGATNPSKLYTPFTLFCIFFSIYLNADLLGQIFLSGKWEVQEPALKAMANRPPLDWFIFIGKVVAYSLGMIFIYGLTQAVSAFLWGLADWANTSLSSISNQSKYVAKSELEKIESEVNVLRLNEKKLYTRIGLYHKWRPEDIDRLNGDLEHSRDSYSKLHAEKVQLVSDYDFLRSASTEDAKEKEKLSRGIEKLENQLANTLNNAAFFRGHSQVYTFLHKELPEPVTHSGINGELEVFIDIVKSHDLYKQLHIYNSLFRQAQRSGVAMDEYRREIQTNNLSFSIGASLAVLEFFEIAQVEVITNEANSYLVTSVILGPFYSKYRLEKEGNLYLESYLRECEPETEALENY